MSSARVLLTITLCLTLPAGARARQAAARPPLLGLAINVREGAKPVELGQNILLAKGLGVTHMHIGWKWRELEPKPGEFNLQPVNQAISGLTALGFRVSAMIQTLDTNNRTLPDDLTSEAFDSPKLRDRWEKLLRVVVPRFTQAVEWTMLGNEVDIYLREHPKELEPFAGFVEAGRRIVRELKPGMLVGVTVTHDGVRDAPALVQRLFREMEVASFTYYPLMPGMTVRPVADVPADMDRMVRAAGSRPILLQELGYPAGDLNKSSEAAQAAYVDACFDFVKASKAPIQAFTFFLMHDFTNEQLDMLLKYYRIPDARFRSFLGTLGFKRADGTPRSAWARFEERARAWPRK